MAKINNLSDIYFYVVNRFIFAVGICAVNPVN